MCVRKSDTLDKSYAFVRRKAEHLWQFRRKCAMLADEHTRTAPVQTTRRESVNGTEGATSVSGRPGGRGLTLV